MPSALMSCTNPHSSIEVTSMRPRCWIINPRDSSGKTRWEVPSVMIKEIYAMFVVGRGEYESCRKVCWNVVRCRCVKFALKKSPTSGSTSLSAIDTSLQPRVGCRVSCRREIRLRSPCTQNGKKCCTKMRLSEKIHSCGTQLPMTKCGRHLWEERI